MSVERQIIEAYRAGENAGPEDVNPYDGNGSTPRERVLSVQWRKGRTAARDAAPDPG